MPQEPGQKSSAGGVDNGKAFVILQLDHLLSGSTYFSYFDQKINPILPEAVTNSMSLDRQLQVSKGLLFSQIL